MILQNSFHKIQLLKYSIFLLLNLNYLNYRPALKKNISSLENQQKDNNQKIYDYKTAIKMAEKDYAYQCDKIGVKGINLEKEVLELILVLPELFKKFESLAKEKKTAEILNYYYDFTKYINSKQNPEVNKIKVY